MPPSRSLQKPPSRSRSTGSSRSRGRRAAASSIRLWISLTFSVFSRRSEIRPTRSRRGGSRAGTERWRGRWSRSAGQPASVGRRTRLHHTRGQCSATKVFAFDIQKSLRFRAGWPGNPARNSGPFRSQVPAFVIARPIVLPDNGDPGRRGFPRLATGRGKEPDIGVMAGALARRVPTGPDNVSKPEVRSRPGLAEPRDGEDVPGAPDRAGDRDPETRRTGARAGPARAGAPKAMPSRQAPRRRCGARPGTGHADDDRAAPCIRRGGDRP